MATNETGTSGDNALRAPAGAPGSALASIEDALEEMPHSEKKVSVVR